MLIFNKIIDKLGKYIEDNEKSKFKNKYSMLKLEYTERDGYYITCTSKRSQVLKKELSKLKNNILKIKINTSKTINFDINEISYKTITKSSVKIQCDYLKSLSNDYVSNINKLNLLCKNKFLEKLEYYEKLYGSTLKHIVNFTAQIDLIKSNAKLL